MPQPNLPPTPGSSTELLAQDLCRSSLDNAFALPPPAIQEHGVENNSASSTTSSSTPRSPEQKTRPRRSSTAKAAGQVVDLPPPPSRSRKIIQMKPKSAQQSSSSDSAPQTGNKTKAEPVPIAGTKRKAGGTSSAAGRKIARKTAHSLIERRRRSKMNEEFATLKDMVPACRGHDMHKLAILQASIDYLRYLQDCISDLKQLASPHPQSRPMTEVQTSPAFSPISSTALSTPYPSPEIQPTASGSQMPTPRMSANDGTIERGTDRSPLWPVSPSISGSPETAPHRTPLMAAKDGHNIDQEQNEATAALLMLNKDRRLTDPSIRGPDKRHPSANSSGHASARPKSGTTGMSVRELLT